MPIISLVILSISVLFVYSRVNFGRSRCYRFPIPFVYFRSQLPVSLKQVTKVTNNKRSEILLWSNIVFLNICYLLVSIVVQFVSMDHYVLARVTNTSYLFAILLHY